MTNLILYTIDLLFFSFKLPFRDNLVNLAQVSAVITNLLAVISAAIPVIFPPHLVPGFLESSFVMWITTVGTGVLTVAAALDPVVNFVSWGYKQVSSCCAVGGDSAAGALCSCFLRAFL